MPTKRDKQHKGGERDKDAAATAKVQTTKAVKEKEGSNGEIKDVREPPHGFAAKVKNLRKKLLNREDNTVTGDKAAGGGGKDDSQRSIKATRNKDKDKDAPSSKRIKKKKSTTKRDKTRSTEAEDKFKTIENEGSIRRKKEGKIQHVPVSKAHFQCYTQFLMEACNIGANGILKQFNDHIKSFIPPGATMIAFGQNGGKNRYKDVACLDQTRIILKGKPGENDYIHANMVDGEPLCNKFIACQGPLHSTAFDFWRMVVQEKVHNIFMLCQIMELNKEKCHPYWPQEKGSAMTFKDITIKNLAVDNKSDNASIISTLQICVATNEPFMLKHYHWQSWPDRSVPQSTMAPFRLLRVARSSKSPTIVHCSAGIGRTGVIIGIEMALQHILSGRRLNMIQVAQSLRMKRMQSIQTDVQFVYMYRCLIAFAETSGVLKTNPELEGRVKLFVRDYDALIAEKANNPLVKTPQKVPSFVQQYDKQPSPRPSKEKIIPLPPYPAAATAVDPKQQESRNNQQQQQLQPPALPSRAPEQSPSKEPIFAPPQLEVLKSRTPPESPERTPDENLPPPKSDYM